MAHFPRQRRVRSTSTSLARRRNVPAVKTVLGRSFRDFHPLLPGEQRLLEACRKGEVASLGTEVPEASNDELRLRAAFLRFLLLGGDEQAPVHERGVQLQGAFVEGMLDLTGCRVPHNVGLRYCRLTDVLSAQDARIDGFVSLEGSLLPRGVIADRLQCDGSIFLVTGFKSTGEVRLLGARIGGSLVCRGGHLMVKAGDAFSADGAVVSGDVVFANDVKATSNVRLLGAQIGGDLECSGGQFEVTEGPALSVDRAVVKGGVFFTDGFSATGEVRLLGAQIGGGLDCSRGQFEVKEGNALSVDRAVVAGDVLCNDGFKATGEVRLLGAQIGGGLDCSGGSFEGKEGDALSADRAVVNGSVFFSGGFKATGMVRLLGAQIGGSLDCSGGQFEVKEGIALSVDRAVVNGSVLVATDFKATGEVRLLGAEIGGNLICRGGHFEVKEGDALTAEGLVVKGILFLFGLKRPLRVNAGHMQVAVLVDAIDSWAEGSTLDGLQYGTFGGGSPTRAKARLEWLLKQRVSHRSEDFRPQPWRHLQRVLREMGHAEDARQIGISFEEQLRKTGRIGHSPHGTSAPVAWAKQAIARTGHALFGWLSGYGYRPMRLLGWMALVWLACALCYWLLALPPYHAIGPSDPLVFQNPRYAACVPGSEAASSQAASGARHAGNWFLCEPLPAEYSTFSPLAYSLDIILPLVDLGQEKAWGPLVPTPQPKAWTELLAVSPGHMVRWLVWLQTLFGWVGSLLLVGIVSGFARRTEE